MQVTYRCTEKNIVTFVKVKGTILALMGNTAARKFNCKVETIHF